MGLRPWYVLEDEKHAAPALLHLRQDMTKRIEGLFLAWARGIIAHERDATLDYLRERNVVMIDGLNRLIHQSPRALEGVRLIHVDGQWLPLVAVQVQGRYLVFGTLLDREAIRARFQGLRVLF